MRKKISVLLVIALIATMVASYFTVDASNSVTGLTISTAKTAFASGEDIIVDISGYTTELQGVDMEFRLEKGIVQEWHGYDNRSSYGYLAYLDIGTGAKDENANPIAVPTSTHQVTFKAGMRVHPEAVASGTVSSIPDGFYTLWVLGFTNGYRKELSNRIYITVGDNLPTLTMSKTVFEVGEDITASYANFTEQYYGSSFTEIDIFAEGGIPGQVTTPSKAGFVVKNSSVSGIPTSGDLSFPDDDTDRNGVNFPLPAGNYYMCLRKDNSVVGIPVKFTIVDEVTATTAPATPAPATSAPPASEYPINITTTKTTFVQGEDIVVSFEGLLESMGGSPKDVELRLDQGHNLTWTFATRPGSKGYADMLKSDIDGSDLFEGSTGSKTFPADDVRVTNGSGSYIAGTGYPVGEYTLWVMDYYGTPGIISNRIEITIVAAPSASPSATPTAQPTAAPTAAPTSAPATVAPTTNPYDITISVEKLTFTVGEDIVVSFDGYDVAGDHDVELRLVKGHNMSDADMKDYAYRHDYSDFSDNYSPGTQQDTSMAITASGTRTFPKDGYGNVSVVAGQYSIAAYDYSNGAKQISNLIEITVVEAGASGEATATPGASGATPGEQNKPTGDASMFAIVALIVACAGVSIVLVKKNKVKA